MNNFYEKTIYNTENISPYAHRILTLDNIVIYGVHTVRLRRGNGSEREGVGGRVGPATGPRGRMSSKPNRF